LLRPWILGLVVFTLGLGVFAGALGGPYILDDLPLISRNLVTQDFANAPRWLSGHLWDTTYGGASMAPPAAHYWRPLVQASYAFDWTRGQGEPLPFHLTNLMLHACASLLAFSALRRWLDSSAGAFLGAALFALHPTKAESVAWISGRPDLLVAIGLLLALEGLARRISCRRGGIWREGLGCLVAFSSKETAIVLPFLAWIEWRASVGWKEFDRAEWPRALEAVGPSGAIAALYLSSRVFFFPIIEHSTPMPLAMHALIVLETLGGYFRLVVWPRDLSLFGSTIGAAPGHPFLPNYLLGALGAAVLVAAAGVVVWARRRLPPLAAGTALFFALLLPIANVQLVPNLLLTSPRFLYVPSLAVALAFGAALLHLQRCGRSGLVWALAGGALGALAARSAVRAVDFTSERAFWSYELAHGKGSETRTFFIAEEMGAHRPRAAIGLLARAMSDPSPDEIRFGRSPDFVSSLLRALLLITPDVDRASLSAIQRFARDVRSGRFARLELPKLGLLITQGQLDADRPYQFLAIEAECHSRLGNDVEAALAARRIIEDCPACENVLEQALIAAARASDFPLARAGVRGLSAAEPEAAARLSSTLDAAAALVRSAPAWRESPAARTQFYAGLSAWGRALASAAPAFAVGQEFDAETTISLGQLALHAGDRERGVAMLSRVLDEARIRQQIERIEREMVWVDAERPPDQPLPVF